jgi:hypothetical protein
MTKTNTRSRIVSILLVFAMLLTMVPITGVTANAAEDDTSYAQAEVRDYDTFATYLRSFDSRDLKLEEDINYTIGINDVPINVIRNQKLDLNGHKITIDASRRTGFVHLLSIRYGEFTLYDSKGGGELAVSFPNDDKAYSIIMMSSEKEDEPSKFTMNGGTLTKLRPNITHSYGASGCIGDDYFNKPENGKRSQITINGGTINCPYEWDRSKSLLNLPVEAMPLALQLLYSNLTVNGGTFNGIVWTDELTREEGETEPRVVLNGGVFNSPFVVEGMQKEATQMVIDGARFNDGFHVDIAGKYRNIYVETIPPLLLKSGVFTSPDKNPKLDIYNVTANSYGNGVNSDATVRAKQKMILHSMKCFPNSAIKVNGKIYTSENIESLVGKNNDAFYLKLNSSNPIEVIRNAWGMKSVTLDGNPIDYFKDWKGTVERMDNSTAHTIKFEWYPLASELVNAGYSYNARCDHYISGSSAVQQTDTIDAGATSHTVTIPAGADPKVYSYDLHLNLKKDGSSIGIYSNEHIVKLVVSEAPPAPPVPVAHSITVTNGRGTANPTSAMAGETVTVKAKDDTANNMMFTRWYTDTPGVTFADATTQETTFVMPDCDVKVNPGFQQVSFTKQPIDSWPQVNHGSKAIVTFSAPITKWELKEGNTTVASSGSLFINTGNPITVDIPAQSSAVEKTYTVVVTANGQKFSSNEFKVSWINWPKAPEVEFTPADGTQFVGEIEVIAFDALYAGEEIFEIAYTTDGTDPKTSTTTIYANTDTEHITLKETTTIKARACNYDAAADDEKWGPLATATFTKYSDSTLPKPTITPEGMTYTGSIKAYLTAPALDGVKMEYQLVAPGEEPSDTQWYEYDPQTGITVNEFGTSVLCARASKSYDAETPDGLYYVATITSETATATYTRTYSAAIDNVTVGGKVGKTMTQDVVIRMNGDRFENVTAGDDVSAWFNLPAGLTAKVKELSDADGYHGTLTVTISGKPTATSAAAITVSIPKDKLYANNTTDLTVLSNPNAYYSIALDADHQHDYSGQLYLYLDPGNHYQECTAGDGYNIQAHEFTAWTDNGNGTHSHHCTVCKMADGSTYTETAEHTWVWVVDQEAALNQPGKQHEECTGCHAKRSENTEIPAPRDYAVTVTGGTATVATGTSITRAMEGVEVTVTAQAPDGMYFVKWVVKAGGVTLANETSATTTFTMPGNDVKIEATYKDAPPSDTPPSDTPPSDTPSYGVYVGMTYTAGNLIYRITSIDTATLGQSKVIGVVAAKKNKITKVTIPDRADCKGYRLNVTTIGNNAFAGCKALKKLTIGNKVTVIGKNAFKKCSKLETVVIGKAVKTISSKAFIGDNKIKKITFKGKKLKTVNKNAFSKKAKKNIKSKKTKLKGNKKAIKLFKKKLKIK